MNVILQKFCSRLASLGISLFAQDKAPAKDGWITVHPNGKEHKGQHVEIDDETGGVKKGFGGKFKGQKISEIRSKFRGPQVNRLNERPDRKPEPAPMRTPAAQTSAGQKLQSRLQDVLQKRQREMANSQPETQPEKPSEQLKMSDLLPEIEDRPIEKDKFRDKYKDASSEDVAQSINKLTFVYHRHNFGVQPLSSTQLDNLKNELQAAQAANRRLHMNPQEVAGVKQGKPMTLSEADGNSVNPKFSKGGDYTINCQSCTLAYELRCRGYNVEARPRGAVSRGGSGRLGTHLSRYSTSPYIDIETGMPSKRIDIECKNTRDKKECAKMLDNIYSQMPANSRYAMMCDWKGKKSGHIFNIAKDKDGRFYLIDSQTGTYVYGTRNAYEEYFKKHSEMERIQICRTDNTQITDDYQGVLRKASTRSPNLNY